MKNLAFTFLLLNFIIINVYGQDTLKAVLVKDIKQSSSPNSSENSSWPRGFTVLGDKIFFTAVSNTNSNHTNLWVTDGSGEGTHLVTDTDSNYPSRIAYDLTAWGDKIILCGYDDFHGYEPWITDGTPENTRMITDVKLNNPNFSSVDSSEPRYFKIFKDKAYFQADNWWGDQLYVTDGTEQGTVMLTQKGTGDRNPTGFIELNDRLFFTAQSTFASAPQLWVTDGTVEGTYQFKDIGEGGYGTLSLFSSIVYKNKLYFMAERNNSGYELWECDGTPEETRLFKEINNKEGVGSHPHEFTIYKDRLYFVANDGIHGNELWCTDGDTAYMVKDISPNSGALDYAELFVANDQLLFSTQQEQYGKAELWISDGTTEGTRKLTAKDGSAVEAPNSFVQWKGKTLFVAGEYNTQLWITDGTSENTRPVFEDARWAPLGSNSSLVNFKDEVYFNANYEDGIGVELYKLTVDSALIRPHFLEQPQPVDVCLMDSAFFEVKVLGRPDFRYQWLKDGQVIENAVKATYTIAQTGLQDAGTYACRITNSVGEIMSEEVTLRVYDLMAQFEVVDSTQTGFYYIRFTGNAPSSAIYEWDFDEGTILSGSAQGPYRVVWEALGTKDITLKVRLNDCVAQTVTTTEVVVTGMDPHTTTGPMISVFPNPVKRDLTLDFKEWTGEKKVSLMDANGQEIWERRTCEVSLRMNVANLAPGVYYVKVKGKKWVRVKKIIKD